METPPPPNAPRPIRVVSTGVQLAETVLMVTAVALGGFLIPGSWGLLEANPHPLWLVILAIAGRYGAPVGYVAATMCGLVYATFLWTNPGRPPQDLSTTELMPAFFMLLTGALLSELSSSKQRMLAAQQRSVIAGAERVALLESELEVAGSVVDELKRRVLHHDQTLTSLAEYGKRLQTLDAATVRQSLPGLLVRALDLSDCATYRVGATGLALESAWPVGTAQRHLVRLENIVIARAIQSKKAVSVHDVLRDVPASIVDGQPVLLAGPVLGASEEVDTVVVVSQLPAGRLTEQTVAEFQALLEWASLALRNCELHEVTRGVEAGAEPAPAITGHKRRGASEDVGGRANAGMVPAETEGTTPPPTGVSSR